MEKDGWQIAVLSTSHLPAVTISILTTYISDSIYFEQIISH